MTHSDNNGVTARLVDTLILTYDRERDHLEVGGKCNSLELMLDMLGRATRRIEQEFRAQGALELRRKVAEAEENARVAAALRKG